MLLSTYLFLRNRLFFLKIHFLCCPGNQLNKENPTSLITVENYSINISVKIILYYPYETVEISNFHFYHYAPVICIPGSLGAGDSGDIAGPKCRDLTFDESRQCRRCAGVLISRQNTILCHILTKSGKLSLSICSLISSCFVA